MRFFRFAAIVVALCCTLGVTACSTAPQGFYEQETFGGHGQYRHEYRKSAAQVCAAVETVMLEQGFVLQDKHGGQLTALGVKEFKIDDVQFGVLEVHAACMTAPVGAVLYLTALERHFEVKPQRSSTTVGIPLISPLSIGKSSSTDALVQTWGETIHDNRFYERIYEAVSSRLEQRE
jgi:hypothetical protein